ncbi:hypothetical protein OHT20_37005 [Streptomyces caniferus]|uniref:Uncharacterized protein n=1 Tax=Streptomyces caniferus TaxID=285557 RepID=A0A640S8Y6_9ACTN|nr:hypothetical protein [Streptomyces caniferus]GFE07660.1 hypothetical protein Scani_39280 [Streptomyces caniferus]
MAIKNLASATGAGVVPVPDAAGHQRGMKQCPVAVLSAGETPADNTPWT